MKKKEELTKVFIRVRKQNNNIPNDVYLNTRRAIGATLTRSGTVNTGLTKEEQKKYLPQLLGIESTSVDWNKEVDKFFASLVIRVVFGEEVALDLAKDSDGEYINPMDYIKFKFASIHPEVAMSKEECVGVKIFYIYNPTEAINKKFGELTTRKEAFKELIKLDGAPEKTNAIMHVLGLHSAGLSSKEKELSLENYIEKNPTNFIEVIQDKDLETKAFIEACITAKVLEKVGTTIIDGDEKLGDNTREAILYLKDKNNSGTLIKLKARLTEFNKK